ncbi:hypothetical protein BDY21DRAFT_61802 [Lineolata rhizophorae]|uniref:SLS1 N-terminal domain-containing protein n=1 Tax=Lineolata rhizophorae TaxID=578093 RepID=A0A6A6NVM2_9PEZI|nr:hypothetical protein BDY21DRAFT_61802 [Lineolata rhizophorae]
MSACGPPRATVCLRCQLRMRLRSHRFTSTPFAPPCNLSSIRRQLLSFAPHPRLGRALPKSDTTYSTSAALGRPSRNGRYEFSYPLGRVHGREGGRMREASVPLNKDSLGKPSEVIILKDAEIVEGSRNAVIRKTADIETRDGNEGGASAQIDQTTGANRDAEVYELAARKQPLLPEILRSMDALRPEAASGLDQSTYVSKDVFNDRVRKLVEGYTTLYLRKYLEILTKRKEGEAKKAGALPEEKQVESTGLDAKGPMHVLAWHPFNQAKDVGQEGNRSVKIDLARKVVRDGWNVRIIEDVEAKGEIVMRLKDWQFQLLVAGSKSSALNEISKQRPVQIRTRWKLVGNHYRRKREKTPTEKSYIQAFIYVIGDQQSAQYAADDITKFLNNSEHRHLPMRPFAHLLDHPGRRRGLRGKSWSTYFGEDDSKLVADISGCAIATIRDDDKVR